MLIIFTIHDKSIIVNEKSKIIEDYDMKTFVDQNDQIKVYISFIKKIIKWYIHLFFYIITQMTLINVWRMYDKFNKMRLKQKKLKLKINNVKDVKVYIKLNENLNMHEDYHKLIHFYMLIIHNVLMIDIVQLHFLVFLLNMNQIKT